MVERNCFVFAGGGTGGHLTPGLAVARQLRTEFPGCQIVFVIAGRTVEQQLLMDQECQSLTVEPAHRAATNPLQFFRSHFEAWRRARTLLKQLHPRAVIGLGGLTSLPVVLAAWHLRIPRVLLEQNVLPGRANRWASRFATAVCVSFSESRAHFPRGTRIVVTGNPVREEIARLAGTTAESKSSTRQILVLGGSLGARALNLAVRDMLGREAPWCRRFVWGHQAGPENADSVRRDYSQAGVTADVAPFFDDMALRLARASLVISRAGATTLAELACAGVPAVLVPYPQATDRHQDHNAKLYVLAGAARMVEQTTDEEVFINQLLATLHDALDRPGELETMRQAMRGVARVDATARVVEVLTGILSRRSAR